MPPHPQKVVIYLALVELDTTEHRWHGHRDYLKNAKVDKEHERRDAKVPYHKDHDSNDYIS